MKGAKTAYEKWHGKPPKMIERRYKLHCEDCQELVATIILPNSFMPNFVLSKDGFTSRFIFDGFSPPSVLCMECSVRRVQKKYSEEIQS